MTTNDEPAICQAESTWTINVTIEDSPGEAVNISAATRKDIVLVDPKGQMTRYAMQFITDGSDGRMSYTFSKSYLKPGQYQFQVDLKFGSWDGPTEPLAFTVRRNLF